MIRLYLLLTLLIPLASINAAPNGTQISSYEGRHFLVGFLDNEIDLYSPPDMTIYISSKYNTNVTITEPQSSNTYTFYLKKNEVAPIEIQYGYEHKLSETIYSNMLVEISSEAPVSCVAKSSLTQSGDKFSIIPTRSWGTEHFAISMPNDYYITRDLTDSVKVYQDRIPRLGEFLVIANENYTNVEVTVAAETYGGTPKDSTIKFMLNKGQSYLVKSKYVHGVKGIHDLTGSKIISDKPVGLISGHMRTSVYQQFEYSPLGSKDHIVEMIPSSNAWSNEYISMPFGNGIKSMFKIVAKDTLSLTITNSLNTNTVDMLPGEARQFDNIDVATHWTATGKFLLSQFMAKNVLSGDYFDFDPSMVIVPALDKMVSSVTYYASNSIVSLFDGTQYYTTFQYRFQTVLLLADSVAKSSVRVNGFKTNDVLGFNEIDANGVKYYWQKVFVPISPGVVNIVADSGRFHAIATGNGRFDSYAMTVGASLLDEEDAENIPPIVQTNELCDGFVGSAHDTKVSPNSGINLIIVDENETTNMDWSFTPISDTTTYIKFSGTVINKNFDAKFKCSIIDYNGNSTEYSYFRPGSLIKLPNTLDYKEVNVSKDSCITFLLRTEADSVVLNDISFPGDSRLDLKVPFSLPHTLMKGKDYYVILCLINEKDNLEAVLDSIQFNFECEDTRVVDVQADIISYNLAANNLTLPKILGGTSYNTNNSEFISFTNVGNTQLVAESLYLPQSNFFTIDTTGKFPDTLDQGETIIFDKITFTQVVNGIYNYEVTLIDDQSILRKATIIGNVGTPLIEDLTLDFEDTRIGTTKNQNAYFENTGTFLSRFTLDKVVSTIANDPNEVFLRSLDTLVIDESDNYELNFTYNPTDINDFNLYRLEASFVERWQPHDTIRLTLLGQPTLPKIRTYDIDLDTIKIFEFKDSLAEVISSLGNEKLEIKRIINLNGDESVFEFDNSFYDNRTIDTSENESLQIRFNGLTLGPQSMLLLVESDALPNYGTKQDTIRITGYVKEQDTLALSVGPENKVITSCTYDTLELEINNTGNTVFTIEDINISSNFSYTSLIDNALGDTIKPEERIFKKVLVFSSGDRVDDIQYDIQVHDITQNLDSVISVTSTLESKQEQIIIEPFDSNVINIGEYFSVYFSGSFPNAIDTTANIQLEIIVDVYNFYLHKTETTINFYDINDNLVQEVKVSLNRESDRITVVSEDLNDFDFTDIIKWDFKVDFLALLHTDLEGGMELVFNMSDCYNDNNLLNILDVEQICTYQFRNINLNSLYLEAKLLSNIVSYDVDLEVNSNSDQSASVYLMDYLGKKYSILEKILFDKGKNNIILNLSDYANGKYILVVQTNSATITKEIIIIK